MVDFSKFDIRTQTLGLVNVSPEKNLASFADLIPHIAQTEPISQLVVHQFPSPHS